MFVLAFVFQGLVIDMSRINNVAFDQQSGICIAGAGATWADVIRILNNYGRAPKTLQSYASFSVGGSVSVNAHGITSDYSLGESLVSLKVELMQFFFFFSLKCNLFPDS